MSRQPRGIRNHNPGNIEYNPSTPWQGLDTPPTDGRFCRFVEAKWGIRAIARTLITYQDRRRANDGSKIDTVREMIERWAPPHENNTDAYVRRVRKQMGLDAAEIPGEVDVHRHADCFELVKAIIHHENGMQPYSDDEINAGLKLAGVEAPLKPLSESRTVRGGQVAAGGVTLTVAAEVAQQVAPAAGIFRDIAAAAPWVALAIVAAGVGYMIWCRIDDHKNARR